jgi:hypothetical protein
MSLAIYAAPFNNDSNDSNNDINTEYSTVQSNNAVANKRKNLNNRTQKRFSKQEYNSEKVNSVLDAIHNSATPSASHNLGDFTPISPPISVGVENTKINNPDESRLSSHNDNDDIDLHNLKTAYMDEKVAEQYYKQFIPNYSNSNKANGASTNYHNNSQYQMPTGQNDNLMTKLNYMIHLLEERQDEKTNNVTEEVVLYSFLGIFMIFIVDSFVRVGKYVR